MRSLAFDLTGSAPRRRCDDGAVIVYDFATRSMTRLTGHVATVQTLAFDLTGKRLATASADRTVRIWSVDDATELLTFAGHKATVESVAWSHDGKRLAVAGQDGTIRLWDATTRRKPCGSTRRAQPGKDQPLRSTGNLQRRRDAGGRQLGSGASVQREDRVPTSGHEDQSVKESDRQMQRVDPYAELRRGRYKAAATRRSGTWRPGRGRQFLRKRLSVANVECVSDRRLTRSHTGAKGNIGFTSTTCGPEKVLATTRPPRRGSSRGSRTESTTGNSC